MFFIPGLQMMELQMLPQAFKPYLMVVVHTISPQEHTFAVHSALQTIRLF
jgi:hypothetical protein